ncbi:type IV toxin-antitoxin system AbiEi family antitoxin [Agromyces sp. SYSU K20354]|uniref:type IV toxin-antitoxin system AbiEi family antitoxin n=1 Tax=Agromyces cavernae TaxID=2898659 RepID=UPI001E43F4F0|nr:type IV toxin-antitoxin system AbiEi family antitoxin [Agromyces cavernae]MCD2442316.1 type IV toxin-antitoxin system AbiEi family antitoxin [Agromyces cavernae]
MARLPAVLGTDDLPLAELCAARIDGELFAIDEGWAPIDEPDLPSLRAAVVALRVSRSLIIERLSAAWVHDALDAAPRTAQFCVPHRSRIAAIADRRITVREVVLTDDEVVELGGVRCTTPARTAFDLLRETSLPDADSVDVVARLLAPRPRLADQVRERLDRAQRMPHRARALVRLDHAVAAAALIAAGSIQPSLTR